MKKYSLTLLIFIGLTSCGIYRQNTVNVPLSQRQGQLQLSGDIGFTGYDCEGSYALTNKIAVIANYSNISLKPTGASTYYSSTNYSIDKHNFGEVGAGYYKKSTKGRIREFFLVAGNGMTSHFNTGGSTIPGATPPYVDFTKANYNRFLIQADFGKLRKKFEYAFSPRIFLLYYYSNYSKNDSSTTKYPAGPNLYADVAMTMRYDVLKWLKISGQFSITAPLAGGADKGQEPSPFNISIGLIMNMNFQKPISEKKE